MQFLLYLELIFVFFSSFRAVMAMTDQQRAQEALETLKTYSEYTEFRLKRRTSLYGEEYWRMKTLPSQLFSPEQLVLAFDAAIKCNDDAAIQVIRDFLYTPRTVDFTCDKEANPRTGFVICIRDVLEKSKTKAILNVDQRFCQMINGIIWDHRQELRRAEPFLKDSMKSLLFIFLRHFQDLPTFEMYMAEPVIRDAFAQHPSPLNHGSKTLFLKDIWSFLDLYSKQRQS